MMTKLTNGIKNAEVVVGDTIQYTAHVVGVVCNIYYFNYFKNEI